MALQTFKTIDLFCFIMCEDAHEFMEIAFGWQTGHTLLHTTLEGSVTTLHDLGGVLGRLSDPLFWALTISWSRLLAHVWSGPKGRGPWPVARNTLEILNNLLVMTKNTLCALSDLKTNLSSIFEGHLVHKTHFKCTLTSKFKRMYVCMYVFIHFHSINEQLIGTSFL